MKNTEKEVMDMIHQYDGRTSTKKVTLIERIINFILRRK